MGARRLVKGMLTWVPGLQRAFLDSSAGGGTGSASYCYGVWLKHLTLLREAGMKDVPRTVVELGPGNSLGTGIATLLSGAERYVAIDTFPHVRADTNIFVLRELVQLFRARASRPKAGFPAIDHFLDERLFPSHILDDGRLDAALQPHRIEKIDHAVRAVGLGHPDPMIEYSTWTDLRPVADGVADLLFSHVVMNQVDDLADVYDRCGRWVRPGGWMSHQLDMTALGTADAWNGHRAYNELSWKIIAGNRPYFVNREPLTTHLDLIRASGFDIVTLIRGTRPGGIAREQLAPRWKWMSDDDLGTESAFVVARRRAD
jgi:hypothetical protein